MTHSLNSSMKLQTHTQVKDNAYGIVTLEIDIPECLI